MPRTAWAGGGVGDADAGLQHAREVVAAADADDGDAAPLQRQRDALGRAGGGRAVVPGARVDPHQRHLAAAGDERQRAARAAASARR